jgi:hypothetical protein
VKPSQLDVEAGRLVVLKVTTTSASLQHDLKLGGTTGTQMLAPGRRRSTAVS